MRLRRETSLGIGAILTIQILLSLLVIALLTRMGPAIEHILEENVYSEAAIEQMLAELALSPPGVVTEAFGAALERAQENVTEETERPLLAAITARAGAAFEGEVAAREEAVSALRDLGRVNRESMVRADDRAKRLGETGAWAAAMSGAVALALGILVYRRLLVRLERPVERILKTIAGIRAGNVQARCAVSDAPRELQQISAGLNWLLDRRLDERLEPPAVHAPEREAEVRRVLGWLLDQRALPTVVVDATGARVAANTAAMDEVVAQDPTGDDGRTWQFNAVPGTSLQVGTLTNA